MIQTPFFDNNGMKLEKHITNKTGKFTNLWKLNNILLKQTMGQKEAKRETRKYLETNESENTTHQNLWGTVKTVMKYIAVNTYFKKDLKSTT